MFTQLKNSWTVTIPIENLFQYPMQPTYPKLLRNGGYKFMSICNMEFTLQAFMVSRMMSLGSFIEQQPTFQVQTLDVITNFCI